MAVQALVASGMLGSFSHPLDRAPDRALGASDGLLGLPMDAGGAGRLNRSSPSCLNRSAQRIDFFHGLLRARPEASGAHETVERGPGHARDLDDGVLETPARGSAGFRPPCRRAVRRPASPSGARASGPEDLPRARPSGVRSEIRSRSTSVNSAKSVVMTFVWMSRLPSTWMFSLSAAARLLCRLGGTPGPTRCPSQALGLQ